MLFALGFLCVCALVLEFLPVLSHYCQYYERLQFFDIYAKQNEQSVHTNTVSAFKINVCIETRPCCTFVTVQFWVVADLIVKLAKDKFGALQTEYQKVTVGVFKRISVCVFFALLHFAFLVSLCVLIITLTSEENSRFSLCSITSQHLGGFYVTCGSA